MFHRVSRRDNLRLMSARDATQLAYDKWARIAYGADKVDSDHIREFAHHMVNELTVALREANQRART